MLKCKCFGCEKWVVMGERSSNSFICKLSFEWVQCARRSKTSENSEHQETVGAVLKNFNTGTNCLKIRGKKWQFEISMEDLGEHSSQFNKSY